MGIPSAGREGGALEVHVRRGRTDVLGRCPGPCAGLGLDGEKADPLGQGHPEAGWTRGPDLWEVAPLLSRRQPPPRRSDAARQRVQSPVLSCRSQALGSGEDEEAAASPATRCVTDDSGGDGAPGLLEGGTAESRVWPRSHRDFAALGLQSPWPLLSGPGGPHWVLPPSPSLPTAAGSPGLQGVGRPSPPPPPHAASFSSQRTSPLCPQVRPQRLCERPTSPRPGHSPSGSRSTAVRTPALSSVGGFLHQAPVQPVLCARGLGSAMPCPCSLSFWPQFPHP